VAGVTEAAARALAAYDWPGNVRELKNVIERVFISRHDGRIDEDELPEMFRPRTASPPARIREELRTLKAALVACQGNKSKAAARLNWSRMTLYRKLARYRLLDEAAGDSRDVATIEAESVAEEAVSAPAVLDGGGRKEMA
jgi:transcriptional regulator of acetoin/glycerol metabolism